MAAKKGPGLFVITAYIYVFLPVALFLMLWLKLYIGIPLGILLILFVFQALRGSDRVSCITPGKKQTVIIIAAALIALAWVVIAGTGEILVQYDDNSVRNGILRLLIDKPWPVTDSLYYQGELQQRGLVYYLGFILPAAGFGKIFSLNAARVFIILWSALGIFLSWVFTCDGRRKLRLWYFPVILFFAGLGVLGYYIFGGPYSINGNRFEWWAQVFRFASPAALICGAFNQVIPAWLLYLLIIRQKDNRHIILLWSASLIMCTFPAVGMLPFVAYKVFKNMTALRAGSGAVEEKQYAEIKSKAASKKWLFSAVSLANLLGIIIALICSAYLFTGNPAGNILKSKSQGSEAVKTTSVSAEPDGASEHAEKDDPGEIEGGFKGLVNLKDAGIFWKYLVFIIIEAGIIFAIILKSRKKEPLLYISMAALMLCPLIRVGDGIDFCMRASIPALFCLAQLSIAAFEEYQKKKKYIFIVLMAVYMWFGVWRGVDVMIIPSALTIEMRSAGIDKPVQAWSAEELFKSNYYSCNTEGKFFYDYLAR